MGKQPLCSAWVPILWGKCRDLFTKSKAKDSSIPDLPYDIIINILTRLPANCILQLWQTKNSLLYGLTTTRHFIRTHLDRATPAIAVISLEQSRDNEIKLFPFDGKAKATSFDIGWCNNAYGPFFLWGSYDGFLLFNSTYGPTRHFYILNPITKEQVILISPHAYFYAHGLFFHPDKKEYEVICVCYLGEEWIWEFQILNLRTNQRTSVGTYGFPPSRKRPPVFINNTFYWMVDRTQNWMVDRTQNHVSGSEEVPEPEPIVSLNIDTREFGTMEVFKPFGDFPERRKYPGMEFQLFEMEGELSLFGTSTSTHGVWSQNYF